MRSLSKPRVLLARTVTVATLCAVGCGDRAATIGSNPARSDGERGRVTERSGPTDPRIRFQEAILLQSTGDTAAAEKVLLRTVELWPDFYPSYRVLGELAQRRGAPSEAADYFEQCLSGMPDHGGCRYGLGRAQVELGQLDTAAENLRRAAGQLDSAEVWSELGRVERRRRQIEASIEAFAQALGINPAHLPSLLGMGQMLIAVGRSEEGEALLEWHREQAALQDHLDAMRRAAVQSDASVETLLQLSDLYRRRHDLEAAEATLRQAVAAAPEFDPAKLALANHLLHHGDPAEAERVVDGLGTEIAEDPAVFFLRGSIALAQGDGEGGGENFERSLGMGPWPPPVYFDAGQAWLGAGYPERAAESFRQAVAGTPDSTEALLGLAKSQHAAGEEAQALTTAQRVLELDPSDGQAGLLLGVLLSGLGRAQQAHEAFAGAVESLKLELLPAAGADKVRGDVEAMNPAPVARDIFEQELKNYLDKR